MAKLRNCPICGGRRAEESSEFKGFFKCLDCAERNALRARIQSDWDAENAVDA